MLGNNLLSVLSAGKRETFSWCLYLQISPFMIKINIEDECTYRLFPLVTFVNTHF